MKQGFIVLAVVALSASSLVPAVAGARGARKQMPLAPGEVVASAEEESVTLRLDGVIIAANPADSIALVRRLGARRGETLRLGQQYAGYVLVEVRRDSVLLENAEGSVRLAVGASPESDRPEPPVAVVQAPPAPTSDSDAVSSARAAPGDGWIRRAFSRVRASERLEKEIPVILNETALVPRIEEGEVKGLVVSRLPDGTLLSEAGLLPGDVLMSINGEPLRGLDALWEVLSRLRDADEIRLLVDRRGETVRLAYSLTN